MAKGKRFTRRDLLKFGAAGAVGACVFAKETPAFSSGKFSEIKAVEFVELPPQNAEKYSTTCRYCHVQCGYNVYVWQKGKGLREDAKYQPAQKMQGDWPNPIFTVEAKKNGKDVCIMVLPDSKDIASKSNYSVRGAFNAQSLYSEKLPTKIRLKKPMIRKGGKGSPLTEVSWDEAIGFCADNFKKIIDKHGPDAVGAVYGDWGYMQNTYAFLKWLFTGIKSSTLAGNGYLFWGDESWGLADVVGAGTRSFTVQDFEETKLIFCAGKNLRDTGSSWYYRALPNIQNGDTKLIFVDPRKTQMAKDAERSGGLFLQINPGTDAILGASLMNVIVKNNLYDKEFVNKYATGFNTLKETVLNDRFKPENAEKITGIPASKIKKAADLLVKHKGRSMVLFEKGIMHQVIGYENEVAYSALGVILGNAGKRGACTSRAGGHPRGTWADPPVPNKASSMRSICEKIDKGEIKALWAFISNIYIQLPNLTKYKPMIDDMFLVVSEIYPTDTVKSADVVFPAATWGEWNTIQASEDRRLYIQQGFMDAPGEAKPDWWIVSQLAKRMGLSGFEWKHEQEIYDEVRKQMKGSFTSDISEIKWDELIKAGSNGIQFPVRDGKSISRLYSPETEKAMGKRFATDDGKAHLLPVKALADIAPYNHPLRERRSMDYPLWMVMYRANENWNTGYNFYNNGLNEPLVSSLYERISEQKVSINPEDANASGIKTGDHVILSSRNGSLNGVAVVSNETKQGVVSVISLYPKSESTPNLLTSEKADPKLGEWDRMAPVNIRKV
ncbi:MAG: molybdopterin-dependent oxidoreductase [Nitrospirae bacterium]|nr:molybdopterin-dependent oxidoreductase [Nitrospirota bacterium]